jgi:hypothetical protein
LLAERAHRLTSAPVHVLRAAAFTAALALPALILVVTPLDFFTFACRRAPELTALVLRWPLGIWITTPLLWLGLRWRARGRRLRQRSSI